jgi:glutamine cyclotransferase
MISRLLPLYIFFLFFLSCKNTNEKEKKNIRIKSNIKIKSPLSNEIFYKKDTINFLLINNSNELTIDSSILYHDDNSITFTNKTNLLTDSILKFGKNNFKIRTWLSNGKIENHLRTIYLYPKESTKELFFEIVNIYPHDSEAYTQGLLIDENKKIYESTGQYGNSTLREVNLKSGKVIKNLKIDDKYFGEGITLYKNNIYLLTWKSKKGFVYDKNTFDKIDEFDYKTEGWGITTVNDKIVMSDGTENLYFMNPTTYKIESQIQVFDNNGKVININELEFINDKIYANIYGKDIILIINYSTGKVENFINLNNIFNKENYTGKIDVLNGIATNNNKIYVTGKWWPSMFEIKIINNESK